MGRVKLNYRFHNPNPPEALGRELLRICIGANMGKVESTIRESFEKQSALCVVTIPRRAQVVELKSDTFFRMPIGEYEGKYYKINNDSIKEYAGKIVLELPFDTSIRLLDETQREVKRFYIDEFVKAVAGKGEREYKDQYRLPSEIYAEQIKNSPTTQISLQFAK